MGIIIDIVVVAFILLSIWMGYKRGLIDCLVKIASFAIAIVLAFVLCAPVGSFIHETTQIDESISQTIEEALSSNVDEQETEETNMPEVITDYIADEIKNATAQTQDAIAKEVSSKVTKTIINGIAFIGIFLVARFALFFFRKIADLFAKIPLIKQVNELRWSSLWRFTRRICSILSACSDIIHITTYLANWNCRGSKHILCNINAIQ